MARWGRQIMKYDEAEALVLRYLDEHVPSISKPVDILKNRTKETEHSWIFFYDRVRTKGRRGLDGNWPLEVLKVDGRIRLVSRELLESFRRQRQNQHLSK